MSAAGSGRWAPPSWGLPRVGPAPGGAGGTGRGRGGMGRARGSPPPLGTPPARRGAAPWACFPPGMLPLLCTGPGGSGPAVLHRVPQPVRPRWAPVDATSTAGPGPAPPRPLLAPRCLPRHPPQHHRHRAPFRHPPGAPGEAFPKETASRRRARSRPRPQLVCVGPVTHASISYVLAAVGLRTQRLLIGGTGGTGSFRRCRKAGGYRAAPLGFGPLGLGDNSPY